MKILKLYGHHKNTGGIVNFQNGLRAHGRISKHKFYHYRTGKVENNQMISSKLGRILDIVFCFCYFPLYLIWLNPDIIEINSSLVPNAFKRDRIYAQIVSWIKPKKKLILFNHGWNYEFKNSFLEKDKKGLRKYFKLFDTIIVLANTFKKELQEIGIASENIEIISTGINLSDYKTIKLKKKDDKTINILFLSRIEKAKGITEYIESIPNIIANCTKVRFIVAGSGSYLNEIKNHPVVKKYKKYIFFKGYIRGQNKFDTLGKADMFIFPSSYGEGCPVSVLEALAMGIPIIYTRVGALPDILQNKLNGICIETGSPEAIANAVNFLLDNKKLRKRIEIENRTYAKQFDLSKIQKELEDIYTSR